MKKPSNRLSQTLAAPESQIRLQDAVKSLEIMRSDLLDVYELIVVQYDGSNVFLLDLLNKEWTLFHAETELVFDAAIIFSLPSTYG